MPSTRSWDSHYGHCFAAFFKGLVFVITRFPMEDILIFEGCNRVTVVKGRAYRSGVSISQWLHKVLNMFSSKKSMESQKALCHGNCAACFPGWAPHESLQLLDSRVARHHCWEPRTMMWTSDRWRWVPEPSQVPGKPYNNPQMAMCDLLIKAIGWFLEYKANFPIADMDIGNSKLNVRYSNYRAGWQWQCRCIILCCFSMDHW